MDDHKYIQLILKELDGDLTKTERDVLLQWLEASEAHRNKAERLRQMYPLVNNYQPQVEIDLDREYELLASKMTKPKSVYRIMPPRKWLVAASLAILLTALWFLLPRNNQIPALVLDGPVSQGALPDGSTVWLEQQSTITYTENSEGRKIDLSGAAYFEVQSNPSRPFQVLTKLGSVQVVGTAFEVRAVPGQTYSVSVQEGAVKVVNEIQKDEIVLQVGEAVEISSAGILSKPEITYPVAAWRLPSRPFDRQPLGQLLQEIEDAYQVTFDPELPNVLACTVTFTITYPELPILLTSLETLLDIKFHLQGNRQYLIRGRGCQ